MKRRKDSGFTLIELMIVIAVIGILAIVLIPRVGTVKEQAKNAGLETNLKVVQGYVESRISFWANDTTTNTTAVIGDYIIDAFSPTGRIVNPFNPSEDDVSGSAAAGGTGTIGQHDALQVFAESDTPSTADAHGSIVVEVNSDIVTEGIVITGYDNNGNRYNTVTVKP